MIQESEIMVGNYYTIMNIQVNGQLPEIIKWSAGDFYRVEECIDSYDDYDEIKLTEDMIKNIIIQLPKAFEYRFSHGLLYIDFMGNTLTAVNTFHGLQNFVRVITNKELTLKIN